MRNNTYTQIHIQMVFAVQNRCSLILNTWSVNNHVKVYHFEPFVTRSPKSTVERTRSPK